MQDEPRGRLAILKLDPLALQSQNLYGYVFDLLFLRVHVIDVFKSAPLPLGRRVDVRPQAADQGTTHKLRKNQVAIDQTYAFAYYVGTCEFA